MPNFRENGVIRCARLESKKSASGAVKKICAAEWSRKMSRGGLIQPPPPAVLGLTGIEMGNGETGGEGGGGAHN